MSRGRFQFDRLLVLAKQRQVVLAIVGAMLIFLLGVWTGDGRLQLNFWSTHHTENPQLPSQLDYSSVSKVYSTLKENYDGALSTSQLLDGLKEGLAQSTNDPYTEYFNVQQAKQFQDDLNNAFSGIGAELGKDSQGNLIIVAPIKGFPADQAGLMSQDIITEINGESTNGMAPDIAATKIRGPAGTKVTLMILRDQGQTLPFTLTRQNIRIPTVNTKLLDGNLGYIQITSFADDTVGLAQKAATTMKQHGVKGIILDLRGDPGGLLSAAVDVASLWLPEGKTIVTSKGTTGVQSYTANGQDTLVGVPTVVLINNGSASASEITAGALHDNNAAILLGVKSYRKGVVQQIFPFADGSELKVTVASWYRPNGQNINKKGIIPDRVVQPAASGSSTGTDPQLAAAESYLINK